MTLATLGGLCHQAVPGSPRHIQEENTPLLLSSWCVKTKVMPFPTKTPSSLPSFCRSENNDYCNLVT